MLSNIYLSQKSKMSVKSRVRSSAQQLKMLTDYMITHPVLANGEFTGYQGRLQEQREWEELRLILNEYGPDKSVEQWKVTWRDLRRKARTECSIANRAIDAAGNSTVVPVLSDQTKRILGALGIEGPFRINGSEESSIESTQPVSLEVLQVAVEHNMTFDEGVGLANEPESQETDLNEVTVKIEEVSEPLPRLTSQAPPGPSDPLPRITGQSQGTSQTKVERVVRQQQQQPRARASQTLQTDLETNIILRDVANQLAIANRHSAIRSRLTYKEKLWRLRKDLFK
ncbi:hypothetical protein ACJJTC_004855 [Scirpophaga incertulas]